MKDCEDFKGRINYMKKFIKTISEIAALLFIIDSRYAINQEKFLSDVEAEFLIVLSAGYILYKILDSIFSKLFKFEGFQLTKNVILDLVLWVISLVIVKIILIFFHIKIY